MPTFVDNSTLGIRSYRRIVTPDDATISRMQAGIGDNLDDLTAAVNSFLPLQGGRLFRGVELTSGTTLQLQHLLGRECKGIIALKISAPPVTSLSAVANASTTVNPSGSANVTLATPLAQSGDSSLLSINAGTVLVNRPFLGTIQAFGSLTSAGVQTVAFTIAARRTAPVAATVGLVESALLSTTQPVTMNTNVFRVQFAAGERYTALLTNAATVVRTFQAGVTGITISEMPCDPSPYVDQTSNASPKTIIPIRSERNCVCDVWVY